MDNKLDSWDFTFIWNVQNSKLGIEININHLFDILLNNAIALKICNAGMNELRVIRMACVCINMMYELIVCTSPCRENKP
jgi:hypothetical protein